MSEGICLLRYHYGMGMQEALSLTPGQWSEYLDNLDLCINGREEKAATVDDLDDGQRESYILAVLNEGSCLHTPER